MVAFLGVVGKGHAHHIHNGQNGKYHQTQGGKGHEKLVGILIEQGLNILQNGIGLLAGTTQAERLIAAADGILPHKQKCDDDKDTGYAVKQNSLRNVTGYIFVNTQVLVIHFRHRSPTQTRKHFQIVDATLGQKHKHHKGCFHGKKQQALNKLTCHKIAKAHDQAGKPNHGSTITQSRQ